MASGDSFSRASVVRPREGGHSQAALHRFAHACPDEMKFGCTQGPQHHVPVTRAIGSRDRYRVHAGPLRVPFRSTTLASRVIAFKGSLIILTLPREEVVMV
ncbi:hypothetical protein CDL15_Pgr008702 [Punica granatum]|uniref:Uncharacterized protein n=1 Tax=Punica granatum TaxID=22663 RepID=A0A218WD08_PUNGR|nr:hypothetical protein CDL15_Pgr008702 [Punica granatum]